MMEAPSLINPAVDHRAPVDKPGLQASSPDECEQAGPKVCHRDQSFNVLVREDGPQVVDSCDERIEGEEESGAQESIQPEA